MSKYTTEVRFICETSAGLDSSAGQSSVDKILSDSWAKIFNFDFPIFDEDYRSVLCIKILKHYYTREIGLETVGLWKLKLETKLNEIMPYYNKVYESVALEYNPLHDTDYYREHKGSGNGESSRNDQNSSSGNRTDLNKRLYSDTPQGGVEGVDSETYLTDYTKYDNNGNYSDTSNASGQSEYKNTDEYLDHVYGKLSSRSYAKMIKEYRETLINVDMAVINELNDLFMKLW